MSFLFKGKECKENIKAEYFFNIPEEINIFVFFYRKKLTNKNKLIYCPKCNNFCLIKFDGYRIILENCLNNHLITDLPLEEYYNDLLLSNKKIINNDPFSCFEHQNKFCSFCEYCKMNLCKLCEEKHGNHKDKIIQFNFILRSDMDNYIKEKNKKFEEFRNAIDLIKQDIDNIISKFENIKRNIDIYYNINNDILNVYSSQKINYYILINIFENKFENSLDEIKEIINEKNYIKKLEKLLDLYDEINDVSQIKIKYIVNKNNTNNFSIKAFGENFVNNNKDKCKVIIGNSIESLQSFYPLTEEYEEIILTNIDKITNMSCMFEECESLDSVDDMQNWNTKKVTDMSKLFYFCTSLFELPNISHWNTKNVKNLSDFISGCKVASVPDLSNWDTSSLENMSYMFRDCVNISSLGGIENWNISNVINLSHIFENCSALSEIPDIGKWDTRKVIDFSYIFSGCSFLKTIPENIRKWNTENAEKMGYIINGCNKLENTNIEEIIKDWKFDQVKDKKFIFYGCPTHIKDNIYLNQLNLDKNQSSGELKENDGCKLF